MAAKRRPRDAGDAARRPGTRSQTLQKRALCALVDGLEQGPRATVAMPYRSGDTIVGRWYAEALDARLTVVCVPSVELAREVLIEYRAVGRHPWASALLVGRDEAAGVPIAIEDIELPERAAAQLTSTTSTTAVREFLAAASEGRRLIVTTFGFAKGVGAALRRLGLRADLVVCQDAHQLHGQPWRQAREVLSDDVLPGRRRLCLRATDVESVAWELGRAEDETECAWLEDEETFGPTLFSATRAQARRCQLVVEPEVAVVAGGEKLPARDRLAEAVLAAIGAGSTRVVSYQANEGRAGALAEALDGRVLPDGRRLCAVATGKTSTLGERRRVAALLETAGDAVVVVASQAGYGVDVDAADCVVLHPDQSATEIVEVVGRCSQAGAGKAKVRIVLPLVIDEAFDEETALVGTSWRATWMSLRALRAGDMASARELLRVWSWERSSQLSTALRLTSASTGSFSAWSLRTLQVDGKGWWRNLERLRGWADKAGHARPSSEVRVDGVPLNGWSMRQRSLRAYGMLTAAQLAALELPGYAWRRWDVAWWQAAACWTAFQREQGPWADDRAFWAALAETRAYEPTHQMRDSFEDLATFVLQTCALQRAGELPGQIERAAAALPGWRWDVVDAADARMADALGEYAAWKGDFNVPHGYVWDADASGGGLALGSWVTAVRRRRVSGRLSAALELVLTRLQAEHPHATPLDWETEATVWRLGYLALRQFAVREGHCAVPFGHEEALPDYTVELWRFVVGEQDAFAQGTQRAERAVALASLPGWRAAKGAVSEPRRGRQALLAEVCAS